MATPAGSSHAHRRGTQLAELVGIGRGVDLILYVWVCLSLIVVLNLHLKLRTQMELITCSPARLRSPTLSLPARPGKRRFKIPFTPASATPTRASRTTGHL